MHPEPSHGWVTGDKGVPEDPGEWASPIRGDITEPEWIDA